jgi:hypothetical protein
MDRNYLGENEPGMGLESPGKRKLERVELGPIDFFGGAYTTRLSLLETFAAQYLKFTDLPVDQVELVETRRNGETTWHFRLRQS